MIVAALLGALGLVHAAALLFGWGGGVAMVLAIAALGRLSRSAESAVVPVAPPPFDYTWALGIAAGLALLLTAASLATFDLPHGYWDAWAEWNVRAKFLAGGPEFWRHAISPLAARSHPEYPFLWPVLVADTGAPGLLAMLFIALVPFVLASTLVPLRGWAAAFLAILVFAAGASHLAQAPWQYVDIPLSVFMLCSLACLASRGPWMLFAAGFFAGCAAFTKNEGIVFAVALAAVSAMPRVAAGALPGLALAAWYKFAVAPPSDYTGQSLGKLSALGKLPVIASHGLGELWNLGIGIGHPVLILAVLAFGLRLAPLTRAWKAGAAVIAVQLLGYTGAFLVRPADLEWQLTHSVDRLLAQVWPSILLLFFLALRPPQSVRDAQPVARKK